MAVVVEGVSRFAVKQCRQRTPWIEADVEHFVDDAIAPNDEATMELFLQLKTLSRELVALLRANNSRGIGLPPMVARRLEVLIAKKDANDAGSLADFMVSAVETSFPERLVFLSAVIVSKRLEKAVAILTRQVDLIKAANQRRNSTNTQVPLPHLIVVDGRRVGPGARARGRRGIASGMGGSGDDDDAEEDSEIEELAKTLKEAGLSPEAEKVAKRELQRLKRMSPVQAEYGVCRTYLETLVEVSRVTFCGVAHRVSPEMDSSPTDFAADSVDENDGRQSRQHYARASPKAAGRRSLRSGKDQEATARIPCRSSAQAPTRTRARAVRTKGGGRDRRQRTGQS
jgi:ATP-dependent Lon protease